MAIVTGTKIRIARKTLNGKKFERTLIVDQNDAPVVKDRAIYDMTNDAFKAYNPKTGSTVSLARYILETNKKVPVGRVRHLNGDRFDFRKSNLVW